MLSDEQLAAMQAAHRRDESYGEHWCEQCATSWPCDAAQLLDALAEALQSVIRWRHRVAEDVPAFVRMRAERDEARREVERLRPIVEAAEWVARTEHRLEVEAQHPDADEHRALCKDRRLALDQLVNAVTALTGAGGE